MKQYLINAWANTSIGGKIAIISLAISFTLMLVSGSFSGNVWGALVASALLAFVIAIPVGFCGGLVQRYINYKNSKTES